MGGSLSQTGMGWELYRSISPAHESPGVLYILPHADIMRSVDTMRKQQGARHYSIRLLIQALRADRLDGPIHCPYVIRHSNGRRSLADDCSENIVKHYLLMMLAPQTEAAFCFRILHRTWHQRCSRKQRPLLDA